MSKTVEMLNSRLSLVIGIFVLFGMLIGYAGKPPYASASDVYDLTQMIFEDRVDELEYKIEEVERRITRILLIPEEDQTVYDANDLDDLYNQKERYIRKMDRLLGEE